MKDIRSFALAWIGAALLMLAANGPAEAQWKKLLKNSAENAAKRETARQVDKVVAGAIRCTVGEIECIENAQENGEDVVLTDEDGEIIYDEEGNPVMDPADLPPEYQQEQKAATKKTAKPKVVNANYDFEAGERVLLVEDFSADNLGDFPRGFEFREGDIAVVELNGERALQIVGRGDFDIPLPETLPEQFTIEIDLMIERHQHVYMSCPSGDRNIDWGGFPYHRFQISAESIGTGIAAGGSVDAPKALRPGLREMVDEMVPIRIMVDGNHGKMYVGEMRVANLPKGEFFRDNVLRFRIISGANKSAFVGGIRIAAGGRDLYEALEADGRVAVHDIHFDTDAATIRPESAATLNRIGDMLDAHPDLDLLVEGHTDATGDFDHNMELSKQRAESVKSWLVDNRGVEPDRLRSLGLGQTQPEDTNDTDEGRQKNRRVELVRL